MSVLQDHDPAFWRSIYEHPSVKPHVGLGQEVDIEALLLRPDVTALRTTHGGFFFVRQDGLGWIQELHTLFTPEGWGREALIAIKAAFTEMFSRGTQMIVTHEVDGNWRSQPPRSFRFHPAGDFTPTDMLGGHRLRLWSLSRADWDASPARRRANPCH